MLAQCANGFGAVALATLLSESSESSERAVRADQEPGALGPRGSHRAAKATSVIFLYMDGGPSQVDSFDPKPRLDREHGQPIKMKVPATQFNNVGNVLKCPWAFRRYGESGLPVSDLFPHIGRCADDLCVIRSMVSKFSEHTSANYFLHTGSGLQGRPSMGSWLTYGLGSECQDLPGFVVLNGGLIPVGGLDNFGSGFLPANHQGSILKPGKRPIENVGPSEPTAELQRGKLALLEQFDRGLLARHPHHDQLEAAIANYELAFRMQSAVPELMDLSRETTATKRLYGMEADGELTRGYGALCLLARRLVERGVRFIELTCPSVGADRWDQHGNLKDGHEKNARVVDQPIAGLLTDLKSRGLLATTLVVWGGEFGRTPMAQGADGRDHNPFGFTMWLAGGGVKGGMTYGATDDYGYYAVENRTEIHDLHATMLHLLGIDHTRLTFRFGGRDVRLTDVHGNVVGDIVA
ncbi:MAG TPA: DUF1501 domain-containing protein [Pirellulales bacterium]|nr:DUF1501 domain-containing protein [Pirellulales bacterium]